jgi:hypothetical protein
VKEGEEEEKDGRRWREEVLQRHHQDASWKAK